MTLTRQEKELFNNIIDAIMSVMINHKQFNGKTIYIDDKLAVDSFNHLCTYYRNILKNIDTDDFDLQHINQLIPIFNWIREEKGKLVVSIRKLSDIELIDLQHNFFVRPVNLFPENYIFDKEQSGEWNKELVICKNNRIKKSNKLEQQFLRILPCNIKMAIIESAKKTHYYASKIPDELMYKIYHSTMEMVSYPVDYDTVREYFDICLDMCIDFHQKMKL